MKFWKKKQHEKRADGKRSYKNCWNAIMFNHRIDISLVTGKINTDSFFEDIPLFQHCLTKSGMTCENAIDFSSYSPFPLRQINTNNLFDCFHGILQYIYYYSNNKLNTEEFRFHFSGAKSQKKFNRINDILSIFDYKNIMTHFRINSIANAFFGVTFKRIKINPIFYSIRLSPFPDLSLIVSFNLEAFNGETQEWDILDERENLNFIAPEYLTRVFILKSTNVYYSSIRIRQTEPSSNKLWGFRIIAFEIHGIIQNLEIQEKSLTLNLSDDDSDHSLDSYGYNPNMDMSEFI